MNWFTQNVLDPLKGAALDLGQDAVAGAISGIRGGTGVAAANPENVPRNNQVVGAQPNGTAMPATESGVVGLGGGQAQMFGMPTWAVALGGVSAALLVVGVVLYAVKS